VARNFAKKNIRVYGAADSEDLMILACIFFDTIQKCDGMMDRWTDRCPGHS